VGRIFLSYAREDVEAARAFAEAIERAGHEVWWDHHLRAGSRFSWDIAEALRSAEAVVVLWSKDSVESAWVQDEAAEGLEGSRLVPVTLDGSKPPLGFRQYHAVGMSGWRSGNHAFEPLFAAISATISGERVGPPPALRETAARQPSIYVLPFANKSGDPEQGYLSGGITEDVVTDLSKISALSVIGHAAPPGIDVMQFATGLGVTHLVEGTVRKSESRLRITVQLIEAATGRSVWAERFEREFSDVFAIQDEISHAIVEALQLRLLPSETSAIAEGRTVSADAYNFYLKARGLWPPAACGDYRKGQEVVRLCSEAVAIDPDYANAWALTALASAELRFWQGAAVEAIAPAERAISLDGQLAEPLCVRALHFEEQGKDADAQAAIQAALKLDSSGAEAHRTAAQLLFRKREFARAIPYLEKAARAPDHASASLLITCCLATKDAAGARRAAQLGVKIAELVAISDPSNGSAFASAARGFAALGETDRARKWVHKALTVDPGNLAMHYSLAATAAGLLTDGTGALDILEPFAESARFRPHLDLLERDPSWDAIRGNARFEAMLQRARKRVETVSLVS
jgi:adenylate cyclase